MLNVGIVLPEQNTCEVWGMLQLMCCRAPEEWHFIWLIWFLIALDALVPWCMLPQSAELHSSSRYISAHTVASWSYWDVTVRRICSCLCCSCWTGVWTTICKCKNSDFNFSKAVKIENERSLSRDRLTAFTWSGVSLICYNVFRVEI